MAPFATWRLRSTGERGRLVVAGVAAVLAGLTLVLLLVRPDGPPARTLALPVTTPPTGTRPAPTPEVRATAARPTRTTGRPTATVRRTTAASTTRSRPSSAAATSAPPTPGPVSVTIEAESATLGGVALRVSCACSGGAAVAQVGLAFVGGAWKLGAVTFAGVTVPRAGDYTLRIAYRSTRDRYLQVAVNGGGGQGLTCRAASSGTVTATVHLAAGANSIKIFNDRSSAPELDKIVVTSGG